MAETELTWESPDGTPLLVLSCCVTLDKLLILSQPWFPHPRSQTGVWGAIRFLEGVSGLPLEVGVQAGGALGPNSPSASAALLLSANIHQNLRGPLKKELCRVRKD